VRNRRELWAVDVFSSPSQDYFAYYPGTLQSFDESIIIIIENTIVLEK
jgi:hypothetical protein